MTRRDDIVAALERAIGDAERAEMDCSDLADDEGAALCRSDMAILRALADALREGVDDTYPIVNEHGLRAIGPVWIIPEPRLP